MTLGATPRTAFRLSPLTVRILSGSLLLLAVIGLIYAGLYGVYVLVVLLGGLALWEFGRLSELMGFRAPGWLLFPLGGFFAFSGTALARVPVELVLSLALIGGLGAFLFVPGRRQGLGRWALGVAGAIYIGMPFNYYLLLFGARHGQGLIWVIFTVLAVVVSDAGALLVGMRLGRRPFFPEISPQKTLEGAIAGVLSAIPVMLFGLSLVLGLNPVHAVILGLLVGITAAAGDLVESQMKRVAGVKDSSQLIPGHGGVLDRIDSLLFPGIVVYLYAFYILRAFP